MVSITGILDSLTPNCRSSLRSSSRRGRMNNRPLRVIGKHLRISSGAWQIPASVRNGASASPSERNIWRRLAEEQPRVVSIQPGTSAINSSSPVEGTAKPLVFEAVDLKKDFDDGQVQALRGVSFRISENDFVAITGPSGCGKSTLLQLLGGLDRPTAGTLRYRGSSIEDLPDLSAYRAHEIGFVFQAFHLLPTFTSFENVQIPMFETDRRSSQRAERALELLKAVGLEHRLNHFPSKLSGGERQRVAIARSLANGPSVLLADEPTGNLDSVSAGLVLDLIGRIHQEQQMTVILVTHDMEIARRASTNFLMKDGQFIDGSPQH